MAILKTIKKNNFATLRQIITQYFLTFTFLSPISVFATEEIKTYVNSVDKRKLTFAAPSWEGLTENGNGVYWEIIKAVYEPLGFEVKLKNMSWNSAMKLMTEYSIVDGVPGETLESNYGELIYPKLPIENEYLAVLFRKGSVQAKDGIPDLSDKKVAMRKGYELIESGEEYGQFELREYGNVKRGIKKLLAGKVDVFVDELAEIEKVADELKIDLYESDFEIIEFQTGEYYYLSFDGHSHKASRNKSLAKVYDLRVLELNESGELDDIYERWDIDKPAIIDAMTHQ